MIKEIQELFELHNKDILSITTKHYELDQATLRKLGGFESFVYR